MRRWHQDKKSRARIEIIPMIDVMMFLLVFFVLISIDVIPAFSIKTKLPSSSSAEASTERDNAVVSLGRGGELQLNGADVTGEALVAGLVALRQHRPHLAVIINGDQTVELQRVIEVMDKIRAAGFQAMSIAVQKRTAAP
ncbi:MAG: biopolymer transporter ExbD [Gallionella sp.]|jgi:biopolymer transport protein ExbD